MKHWKVEMKICARYDGKLIPVSSGIIFIGVTKTLMPYILESRILKQQQE